MHFKQNTFGGNYILAGIFILFLIIGTVSVTSNPNTKGVFNTNAAKKKLPIYCVETNKKQVSISFDAAWGADDTDKLLQILKENNVTATFFLCGYWVDKYPQEVKKIALAGHDLGNHSDTHPHMSKLSLEQIKNELMSVHEKVKTLTGINMHLFRPPFGEYNDNVITASEQTNYYTIQWDIDSLDWMEKGKDHEINQVLNHKHLGNGSIILFHNDAKYTPEVLDTIIKGLIAKGYEIVPISDLVIEDNFYMDYEGRQKSNTKNVQ